MGLRFSLGGFGTPFFGIENRQVRLEGPDVVVQTGEDDVAFEPVTTLTAAAEHVGAKLDATVSECFDAPRWATPTSPSPRPAWPSSSPATGSASPGRCWSRSGPRPRARAQSGAAVARALRRRLRPGDESAGRRAGYGCSPGDHHADGDPEPYLYFSLWERDRVPENSFWNASFGAKLAWSELAGADDQRKTALQFFRRGRGDSFLRTEPRARGGSAPGRARTRPGGPRGPRGAEGGSRGRSTRRPRSCPSTGRRTRSRPRRGPLGQVVAVLVPVAPVFHGVM